MPVIIRSRNHHFDALKNETSNKRVGAGTNSCLMLRDLYRISVHGFLPAEHAHVTRCPPCRDAYNSFMRIKRDEARVREKLDPYDDVLRKAFSERSKR